MGENKRAEKPKIWRRDPSRKSEVEKSEEHLLTSEEEFERAFEIIKQYPKRVTFFGSARTVPSDEYCQLALDLAARLSKRDYAILTGGGGGIMDAANEGAFKAGGPSLGFNIYLPHEQTLNPFTTGHLEFYYFFTRKVMMTFYSHAYIFFPGGFGTLDEFFEVLTLMQTKRLERAPLILVGRKFWGNLDKFIHKNQLAKGMISPGDEKIYTITEDIDEICQLVINAVE